MLLAYLLSIQIIYSRNYPLLIAKYSSLVRLFKFFFMLIHYYSSKLVSSIFSSKWYWKLCTVFRVLLVNYDSKDKECLIILILIICNWESLFKCLGKIYMFVMS